MPDKAAEAGIKSPSRKQTTGGPSPLESGLMWWMEGKCQEFLQLWRLVLLSFFLCLYSCFSWRFEEHMSTFRMRGSES